MLRHSNERHALHTADHLQKVLNEILEKVTINDEFPLKAARRDYWCFESKLQINQMPFHLDSLWGAIMPLRACAWTGNGTEY